MSSSKKFCSPEDIEKINSETTYEKDEMQIYENRILQCALAEKITPMDLKHWPFFHVLKPEFLRQIHMVMVYGKYIAIIVTKDKNVYSLDYNEDDCSKTSDIHIAPDLKQIEELCGKNIKTFACSSLFILALTEEGKVYFCEIAEKTIFSQEIPAISTFIRVVGLSDKFIVDIGCGECHGLALTSDGKVYAWGMKNWKEIDSDESDWEENESEESDGEENDSQVGNKNIAHFNVPWQVKYELEKRKVVRIACGEEFNIVVTDENTIYGWGNNEDGQISIVRPQKYYKQPRKIITFSDKIVKIVCGYQHTLALTNKGEVYAWGNNFYRQVGVNSNGKPSGPIVVNVPLMGKVLNVDAYGYMSVAVGYDRTIYVWGSYFDQFFIQPFRTKFLRVFDVFAHSVQRCMHKPLIVHDSVHTVRITNNYNYKYTEEILNMLESLGAAFDDPLTSDFTIQVEGQPIYVHKVILNIRCQYFRNMFHHDWTKDIQSTSDSSPVYTIPDKFSYIVYKAFLKYLYTGTIDLSLEKSLELMELAELYCETNLKKDCSHIMKQTITVSNVAFLYNKAIEYNAKELEEFCFQFALRHMIANTLSKDYIELDMSTEAKLIHRSAIQNNVTITSSTFYSSNKNVEKRNFKTTTKKDKMQKYEKRILQCVLAEKIISMDIKHWQFFHVLKPEFISQIHMVMIYSDRNNGAIIVTKDKNVYSLDYKEEHLKTGDIYTALYLKEIKELCGKSIKTFAHSWYFILALTEEGEVYFCEIAQKTIFSHWISSISTFIRVVGLSDKFIVDIGCGERHGLALTSDGKVYAWRENDWEEDDLEESDWEENDSQVDNENKAHFIVPRQVKHALENKKVVHIACGATFNIVVTDENKLYGWGYNYGQISIVQSKKCYKYPHEMSGYNKQISDKIVKVVCGDGHTLTLTNKGEVYAWGNNFYGQVGVNSNRKPSGPTVVNVPKMGKVLDIAAYDNLSVAVGCDKTIYVWGNFYYEYCTHIPFPTKFSKIHDVFAHCHLKIIHKPLIVFTNNFKYVEEVLNILEILRTIFDDPLTSDLTIRVEGRLIYVHKAILKIRCQYFKNMFQHDWIENIQSISDSVYTVSDKFSYVVYKAFLKYLYTGIIDLPSENALELMELADMYCETNLIKDSSEIIKNAITVSNVAFFYNKAIEYNAKELEEFCFQFALRHMEAVALSEEYIKLNKRRSTKDNFMRRGAK